MQTTEPTNHRVKALAVQATEIKQYSDHCSGQSEARSEVNLDAFARMLVEECVSAIEQHCAKEDHGLVKVETLKVVLRAHFLT